MERISIYTDGACSGNPGPGAWAVVVARDGRVVRELTGTSPDTTNQRMELTAAMEALRFAITAGAAVDIISDSEYVVKGVTLWLPSWRARGWRRSNGRPVENQDLWSSLDSLLSDKSLNLTWRWVPGHMGTVLNERANELAQALCKQGVSVQSESRSPKEQILAVAVQVFESSGREPNDYLIFLAAVKDVLSPPDALSWADVIRVLQSALRR